MSKSSKIWDLSWFNEIWESLGLPPEIEEQCLNSIGAYGHLLDSKGIDYQNLHIVTVLEKGEDLCDIRKAVIEVVLKRTQVLAYESNAWKCKLHENNFMLVWIGGSFDRLFCCAFKTLREAELGFETITSLNSQKIKE